MRTTYLVATLLHETSTEEVIDRHSLRSTQQGKISQTAKRNVPAHTASRFSLSLHLHLIQAPWQAAGTFPYFPAAFQTSFSSAGVCDEPELSS